MNIIFLSANKGTLCSIGMCKPHHYLLLLLVVGLLGGGIGYIGYSFSQSPDQSMHISEWKSKVHKQQFDLDSLRQESDASIEVLSSRMGLLQAHVNRIDALGQKLIHMAEIDSDEFDFNQTPAVGGPETQQQSSVDSSELHKAFDQLSRDLAARENQLLVLEDLLMSRNLLKEVQPSGRPIING